MKSKQAAGPADVGDEEQVLRARRKQAAAMCPMAEAAGEDVDEPPPPPPVEDTKEVRAARARSNSERSFWSGLFAFSMVAAPALAFLVLVWLGHGSHGDDLLANLRRVSPLT